MAYWGAHALVALLPQSGNVPGLNDVRINGSVLAFTLGIVVLTTLVFGARGGADGAVREARSAC